MSYLPQPYKKAMIELENWHLLPRKGGWNAAS